VLPKVLIAELLEPAMKWIRQKLLLYRLHWDSNPSGGPLIEFQDFSQSPNKINGEEDTMRCLRLITLFTGMMCLVLSSGLREADAGACKKLGFSNGCITSADVRDDNLRARDLNDEAGADFRGGNQSVGLDEDEIVRSVTITAPRSGVVIVNASGDFLFYRVEGRIGRCSITTGTLLDSSHLILAHQREDGLEMTPFAATRGYKVGKGSTTFNLVCDRHSGVLWVTDVSLTAIYTPIRY